MQIKILPREQISNVDINQWDTLANSSLFVNPFYESWSLIPALELLQRDDKVYLVAAYTGSKLVALFPIHLKRSYFGIQYLSLWQHEHCFICDPLCQDSSKLARIFNHVLDKMNVSMIRIPQHSELSYGVNVDNSSVVFSSTRGAIFNTADIKNHLDSLPRRTRIENKRITKRLFKETNAVYKTSTDDPNRNWLADYCNLEHQGWKKRVSGSILSDQSVYDYYQCIYDKSKASGRMGFQGISDGDNLLAISFRLTSHDYAFEMKTTYNEQYKRLYPGVVLELLNLIDLSKSKYRFVDSNTSSDNYLINRLWPEQRKLVNSMYFNQRLSGKLLKLLYRLKNRV